VFFFFLVSSESIEIDNAHITDRGRFTSGLTDADKHFIISNGPCRPLGPYQKDKNNRNFSNFYYTKISTSGIKTDRMWLCYSKLLDKCYCQPCWLFSKQQNALSIGFNDWIHLNQVIKRHEENYEQTIDSENQKVILEEISVWKKNSETCH
jgi:hypothetical protein